MKISARNVFPGRIAELRPGEIEAEVALTLDGGEELVAVITQASAKRLGLVVGSAVTALVKASSVLIMTEGASTQLSARNCLQGFVKLVKSGDVDSEVVIGLASGVEIAAVITHDSVVRLGLQPGVAATAVIKASSVILGLPGDAPQTPTKPSA